LTFPEVDSIQVTVPSDPARVMCISLGRRIQIIKPSSVQTLDGINRREFQFVQVCKKSTEPFLLVLEAVMIMNALVGAKSPELN
jgi:hypothetical protein